MIPEEERQEKTVTQKQQIDLGDGDYVEAEGIFEDPEHTDPNEGQSDDGKPSEGESDKYPEGFTKKYADKSREDLLKQLYEQEKHIGKQSEKIGSNRDDERTAETAKQEIKSLDKKIVEQQNKLDEMDAVMDPNDYKEAEKDLQKLKSKYEKLEDELLDLTINERIERKYNEDYNNQMISNARESYKDEMGLDFDEDAWKEIAEHAKKLNGAGKMTAESFESAVMQAIGKDKYRKILSSQSEVNMREKMRKAQSNAVKVAGDKAAPSATRIEDMTDEQFSRAMNKLPAKDFIRIAKKLGYDVR